LPHQSKHQPQKPDRNQKNRPSIQSPLSAPQDLTGRAKRSQIWNRPLVPIRPARTEHVLQQMQMKTQQRQRTRHPSSLRKYKTDRRNYHRKRQAVQLMVIPRKPLRRMRRIPRHQIRDRPSPSTSGITHASVIIARSLRSSDGTQFATAHPVRKCVAGFIFVRRILSQLPCSANLRHRSNHSDPRRYRSPLKSPHSLRIAYPNRSPMVASASGIPTFAIFDASVISPQLF
jgi:hypothetical protein